jgi:peptidoglycan hydrolase-like protein with peptidoglycan-binding domain
MKKYLFIVLMLTLVLTPVLSQATTNGGASTVAELQALIVKLQAQIKVLQQQQSQQKVAFCAFSNDLSLGDGEGDGLATEISALHKVLIAGRFLNIPKPTGWYGKLTLAAVKNWQIKNGLPATGVIGAKERAVLCGDTIAVIQPGVKPIVYPKVEDTTSQAPTSIKVNIQNISQYGEDKSSVFVTTSIGAGLQNNLAYSWGLEIGCSEGVDFIVPSKTGGVGQNLCGTTQKYYSYNYPTINQGIVVLTAEAKNNSSDSSSHVGYALRAYDAKGNIIGGDKDIVPLGVVNNAPVLNSATYVTGKDTAFILGSKLSNSLIYFNGTVISKEDYTYWTDSQISFVLPTYQLGVYPIYVISPDGQSNVIYLTIK